MDRLTAVPDRSNARDPTISTVWRACTGDAELLTEPDLENWKSCYAADLAHVDALALPHHGSDKNSGDPLQALCPIASLLAHVSAKRSIHPGANVTLAADERLCCVTRHFDTAANMDFSCP
ncbi:hypothetical protein [Sulfitobacter sp. 20_GPM-1509m]|uniref:hypothetical protein n=1 Tax=Sulfitobacter sp. 20_GPM-1509m TaxID=1380367 RepID=UPI0018CBF5CC|nr:hypothetical protein [Sulfitobacter sp. 20_GPM-1509m]